MKMNTNLLFITVIIFLSISTSISHAYYNLSPKGFSEGLLGNNGIALDASVGANVYNPAGLNGLEQSNFSAATSVLSITQFNVASNQLSDRSPPPNFKSSSAYLMNQIQLGAHFISFYFSNEIDLQVSKYFLVDILGTQTAANVESSVGNSKFGVTYAGSLSETFFYGIGPMIHLVNTKNLRLSKSQTATVTGSDYNLESVNETACSIRLGGLYKMEKLNLGFYFEPQGQEMSSSRTEDSVYVSTDGTVLDKSNTTAYSYRSPMQYGVGIKYSFNENHYLVFDIDKIERSDKPGNQDEQGAQGNYQGLGYRWKYSNETAFMTGFKYSEVRDYATDNNLTLLTYINLGASTKVKFLTNLINLFTSRYESIQDNGSSTIENTGISFATSYSY